MFCDKANHPLSTQTAESLKEKITSIRVSLSDTLMPTLLEMPDPETSLQLKLDELVWYVLHFHFQLLG